MIYSNAALQWVPDHDTLFPRLVSFLQPDGILAVQMPANFIAPSHTSIFRALRAIGLDAIASKFESQAGTLLEPTLMQAYHRVLSKHCRELDLWTTEYAQILSSSTGLRLLRSSVEQLSQIDEFKSMLQHVEIVDSDPVYHPVLEWTKGTFFAPILRATPEPLQPTLQAAYSLLLLQAHPLEPNDSKFETLFPFKRLFIVARR